MLQLDVLRCKAEVSSLQLDVLRCVFDDCNVQLNVLRCVFDDDLAQPLCFAKVIFRKRNTPHLKRMNINRPRLAVRSLQKKITYVFYHRKLTEPKPSRSEIEADRSRAETQQHSSRAIYINIYIYIYEQYRESLLK